MTTPIERQRNIDKLFDNFLAGESPNDSLDETIEAFNEVVYNALLEKLGYTNSSVEQKSLVRIKMSEYMMDMDFNSPSLAHAEKMLHSIGTGNFEQAAQYLDQLYKLRARLISQSQSDKAKKPRPQNPLTAALSRMVKLNPEIGYEDVLSQLDSDTYSEFSISRDRQYITYERADGKVIEVDVVNIPSRLSRLRHHNK
jgi:hypothetical protein